MYMCQLCGLWPSFHSASCMYVYSSVRNMPAQHRHVHDWLVRAKQHSSTSNQTEPIQTLRLPRAPRPLWQRTRSGQLSAAAQPDTSAPWFSLAAESQRTCTIDVSTPGPPKGGWHPADEPHKVPALGSVETALVGKNFGTGSALPNSCITKARRPPGLSSSPSWCVCSLRRLPFPCSPLQEAPATLVVLVAAVVAEVAVYVYVLVVVVV